MAGCLSGQQLALNTLITLLAAAVLSLSFDGGSTRGVCGEAAFFDGFDSRIVIPAAEVKASEKYFTVDVWVCPVAFPKSPCPVASRQRGDGVKAGVHRAWDGESLILWLPVEADSPVEITF